MRKVHQINTNSYWKGSKTKPINEENETNTIKSHRRSERNKVDRDPSQGVSGAIVGKKSKSGGEQVIRVGLRSQDLMTYIE